MKKDVKQKLEEKLGKKVLINEPLAPHTTFKIGGGANFFYQANSTEELIRGVKTAKVLEIPYFILGGGSNILIGDRGFHGLVIKNKTSKIKILGYRGKIKDQRSKIKDVLVEANSGVPFNQLVRFTIEEGLEGLEDFLGLPGSLGGAVVGNAHWQNQTVGESVISKNYFEKVLLSAVFKLRKEDKNTLWEKARREVDYRQKTQPQGFSAGCIFKNIKKSEALRLGTPNFTTSAGFLIEAAGLKGFKMGQAQVSCLHANFIINRGGAKASDVVKLINLIKEKVKGNYGINLEDEIIKVGEF